MNPKKDKITMTEVAIKEMNIYERNKLKRRIKKIENILFPVENENQRITKNQSKIIIFIGEYIKKNNKSPRIRDIQKFFKYKSLRTVSQYLEILEKKGFIYRNKYEKRGIRLRKYTYYLELKKGDILKLKGIPVELIGDVIVGTNTSQETRDKN